MDPPYLYKLPQGTSLFRAKTIAKEGRWYALSLDDAYTYGSYVTEYSTVKDLRLINIMSLTFQNDFMDRLTVLYPGSDYSGMDRRRISSKKRNTRKNKKNKWDDGMVPLSDYAIR